MKQPSVSSLERALFAALQRDTVRLTAARMPTLCAVVAFKRVQPGGQECAAIRVDAFNGGILASVVHELIHVCRYRALEPWGQLEEAIVEALEDAVVAHINANAGRHRKWRRAVEAKLAQGAP